MRKRNEINQRPQPFGGRIPFYIYVDPDIFDIIEERRGKESRNSYLNGIIKTVLKEGAC